MTSARDAVEQAILVSVGAAAITRDRIEGIVGELTARGHLERADARAIVERLSARMRGDAPAPHSRILSRVEDGAQAAMRDLGFATRDQLDELKIRLSELERRIGLIEGREG